MLLFIQFDFLHVKLNPAAAESAITFEFCLYRYIIGNAGVIPDKKTLRTTCFISVCICISIDFVTKSLGF